MEKALTEEEILQIYAETGVDLAAILEMRKRTPQDRITYGAKSSRNLLLLRSALRVKKTS
jgi:hypothetical protein